MGDPVTDAREICPTWYVDIHSNSAGLSEDSFANACPNGLATSPSSALCAGILQAFSDAIMQASDLTSLQSLVARALGSAGALIAGAWLYRRTTLQGPYALLALGTSHDAAWSAAEEACDSGAALLAACADATALKQAKKLHIPIGASAALGPYAWVFAAPLSIGAGDTPDGAVAFALAPGQLCNGAIEALFLGLAARLARAWRKHEQQEHKERIQAFLNNAMEAAYAGIWHIDLKTGQTVTSPTTNLIFGEPVTNQDIFGLVNRLIHPDDRDYIRSTYYAAIKAGEPYYHEYRIIRRDGAQRWLCSRGIPVYAADGSPAYVSGIIADITARVEDRLELEALAKRLEEAVGCRDVFLARASHELKTPLTALQLQIENQRRKMQKPGGALATPEMLLAASDRSLAQITRLRRLIDDMMDVSRIRTGRLSVTPALCNLSRLTCDASQNYAERASAAHTQLHLAVQDGVWGHWDAGRLEQVITNLLNNWLRYAPGTDGFVSLSACDGQALLRVEDCGPGVDQALQTSLFDSFRSGDTQGAMGGLGLGLHICQEIVLLHQGSLTYRPRAGGGSCFEMRLPNLILAPL